MPSHLSTREATDESEGLEEEEDAAALPPAHSRVHTEYTVLRSATYAVPQLYVRAWDDCELARSVI